MTRHVATLACIALGNRPVKTKQEWNDSVQGRSWRCVAWHGMTLQRMVAMSVLTWAWVQIPLLTAQAAPRSGGSRYDAEQCRVFFFFSFLSVLTLPVKKLTVCQSCPDASLQRDNSLVCQTGQRASHHSRSASCVCKPYEWFNAPSQR